MATAVPHFPWRACDTPPEFRRLILMDGRGPVLQKLIPYAANAGLLHSVMHSVRVADFDLRHSEAILDAGKKHGMAAKVHAEELSLLGGAELAARVGAVSADHLEHITERGIQALHDAVLLARFFRASPSS